MSEIYQWWMVPFVIFLSGYIWARYLDLQSTGYLRSFEAILVFMITVSLTIGIIIGHFL
jgi:hypothetical protein